MMILEREVSVLRSPIFHKKSVFFNDVQAWFYISSRVYFFAVFFMFSSWLYSLLIKANLVLRICIFFVLDTPLEDEQSKTIF